MIKSFACKETEKIWNEHRSKKFPPDIQQRALRKLLILDAAARLEDLLEPTSNRLESLQGNRKGQMSIRINQQWRVCFVWDGEHAHDVHMVDYH